MTTNNIDKELEKRTFFAESIIDFQKALLNFSSNMNDVISDISSTLNLIKKSESITKDNYNDIYSEEPKYISKIEIYILLQLGKSTKQLDHIMKCTNEYSKCISPHNE